MSSNVKVVTVGSMCNNLYSFRSIVYCYICIMLGSLSRFGSFYDNIVIK